MDFRRKLILIIIGLLIVSWIAYINDNPTYPQQYQYHKLQASNEVILHVLETNPENVRLQAISTNVTKTTYYGINGGFFWEGTLLSIAVINNKPVQGVTGQYGSGWYNTGTDNKFKRGTLVWDGYLKRFSVQLAGKASELFVADIDNYWAQGGVSMSLVEDFNWQNEIILEKMPSYDELHMRSALVYDAYQQLYMIVTPTPCTIEEFRNAIIEKLGNRRLVDGIFLDGDGSSQLKSRQAKLSGDHRQVYQMLRLVE
ncbi:hypothetical protein EHS13_10480 [Paenibacillus psychroresistens]|uniref:Phosphodiester glycosidase domain-containing protein n=1 Tax=Paenibacillus psychroresistens TaxID=1778678 RepID=A0A6B8RWG8_9BACL|nr:hypothetical protein [Paenibacillus psychroresistens]QGR00030.1 hypothetical protein EHS13_10480 [Paenibacillus psychroresistens]